MMNSIRQRCGVVNFVSGHSRAVVQATNPTSVQWNVQQSWTWIRSIRVLDWIGLGWVTSFLLSNHSNTVDAVSYKLW